MNKYSCSELLKNAYSLIFTKFCYPKSRLIRRPIYIRGKKSIAGGIGLTTGRFCRFDLDGNKKTLFIGKNCQFGDFTHIVGLNCVEIGNDVLIASKVFISDANHGNYSGNDQSNPNEPPNERSLNYKKTVIGNNVWIGENVVVLAGAEIGDGCIIGANSIITKKIPPYCIVTGANQIRKIFNFKTGRWEEYERN